MLEASQVSKLKSQLNRVAGYCSLWRPRRPVWCNDPGDLTEVGG